MQLKIYCYGLFLASVPGMDGDASSPFGMMEQDDEDDDDDGSGSWDLDRYDIRRKLCRYIFGRIEDAADVVQDLFMGSVTGNMEEMVQEYIDNLELNEDVCDALYPEEKMWGAVCT